MEYTYATITLEQALRIFRYVTTHTTDVKRFYAHIMVKGAYFSSNIYTSWGKTEEILTKDFIRCIKAVGRNNSIKLQIFHDPEKGCREFNFYER